MPDPTVQQPYYTHPSYDPVRSHAAFNRFVPPVSGHSLGSTWGYFGTKPAPDSAWARYVWKGIAVGTMHEAACHYASLVCEIAKHIQSLVVNIERVTALNLNKLPVIIDPKNFRKRLGTGIELFVELVHFAVESYLYHKEQIDMTIYMPACSAAPVIQEHGFVFEKLRNTLKSTWNRLCEVNTLVRDSKQSVDAVFRELVAIFEEWNEFCAVPSDILTGVDDTFFVEADKWRNYWIRRRCSAAKRVWLSKQALRAAWGPAYRTAHE